MTTGRFTASAGLARALADFAAAKGAPRERLLAAAGLSDADIADQDRRIAFDRYAAMMRTAIEVCKDPALALKFGADSDFRKFSVVGLIAHASATMLEALEQLNRYGRLVIEVDGASDGPRFANVFEEGRLYLEDRRRNPNAFPELTETTFSRFICGARRDFPAETFALAAEVTHAAPPHWRDYEAIWQVPVAFGAARNRIAMNPAWPALVIQADNRYAFGILSARAEALLAALDAETSVRGAVERKLLAVLHKGPARAEDVAAKLGMSRQTLYRRLKEEGAGFEEILDDLRRRLALDYLAGRKVSVNETAYLVGYSDPSTFSRAFRRWTGRSPRAYLSSKR